MDKRGKDCVETIKSESGEMSVDLCTMVDSCNCGGKDCCSKKENKND